MKKSNKLLWILLAVGLAVALLIGGLWVRLQMQLFELSLIEISEVPEHTLEYQNGDRVYCPDTKHIALDPRRTILYYDNVLLVMTDDDLPAQEQDALAQLAGGEVVGVVSGNVHAFQIRVPQTSLTQLEIMADVLMNQPGVLYAYSDYPVQIMGCDEVPYEDDGEDWLEAIGAKEAWKYLDQCQNVNLGIVDSGFDVHHPDLEGKVTVISDYNTADDHGTHVAGIIGAKHDHEGIRGINDKVRIYGADVWELESEMSYHTMAELLEMYNLMLHNDVKAINNSWGCYIPDMINFARQRYGKDFGWKLILTPGKVEKEYEHWKERRFNEELTATAHASAVLMAQLIQSEHPEFLMVQAAGNDCAEARWNGFFCGITEDVYNSMDARVLSKLEQAGVTYEQIDEHLLVVGAADFGYDGEWEMADFSNFGETVDIFAPGVWINSTTVDGYEELSGTSMAAPMVTGSAGYLWSLRPELTAKEVRNLLLEQAPENLTIDDKTYPLLNLGTATEALMNQP